MPKTNLDYVSLFGKDSVVADGNIVVPSHLKIAGLVKMNIESAGKVVITENGVVDGHIKAAEVLIHGEVNGNVTADEGLTIYQNAVVKGHVGASEAKVYGKVMGDVIVSGALMIFETGFVNGKLVSCTLNMEEGAFCNSDIIVGKEAFSKYRLKREKEDAKGISKKRPKTDEVSDEVSEPGKKTSVDTTSTVTLADTDKVQDQKVFENGEKHLKSDKKSKSKETTETETDKHKHVLPKYSKNNLPGDKEESPKRKKALPKGKEEKEDLPKSKNDLPKDKHDLSKEKKDLPKDNEWLDRFW